MIWLTWVVSNVILASLVAATAYLVARRMRSPAVARVLWILALIKLVTPPLVVVPLGALTAGGTTWRSEYLESVSSRWACALGLCACGEHAAAFNLLRGVLPWVLLGAWGLGAAVTAVTAWRRYARFRQLIACAAPAPAAWQSLATQLAAVLSLRRPPEVLALPGRLPPLVVPGLRRPRLLLPAALLSQLDEAQRTTLLMHELTHLARGDHLVRLLEMAVHIAYWWLPLAGVVSRQLRACEETCCDAAVVAHVPQARHAYARLLLDVVDFAQPLPRQALPQATGISAAEDLERRLRAILDTSAPAPRSWPVGVLIVGLACALLPCQMSYDLFAASTATSMTMHKAPSTTAASTAANVTPARAEFVGCSPPVVRAPVVPTFCCPP